MGSLLKMSQPIRIRHRLAFKGGVYRRSPAFVWGDFVFRLTLAHTGDRVLAARKANAMYRKMRTRCQT